MICGEDDEDAGDKNTGAIGLELEQARGVGLFHSGLPTTDLQKMNNLPKYKKKLCEILRPWAGVLINASCLSSVRIKN